jgi:hypothetical protein
MYSQSKGRQFGPGEQSGLVEYLVQTCPLDPNQETEQDRKLNLILSKVQEHQSSLRQPRQIPDGYATIPRSNSSESKKSAPRAILQHQHIVEVNSYEICFLMIFLFPYLTSKQ